MNKVLRPSHLRLVPAATAVAVPTSLERRGISIKCPLSFQVFPKVTFSFSRGLTRFEHQATLRRAISEFQRKANDPKFLDPLIDFLRRCGVEEVTVSFSLHGNKSVRLHIIAELENFPQIETARIPILS